MQKKLNFILNNLINVLSLSYGNYFVKKIEVLKHVICYFKKRFDINVIKTNDTPVALNKNNFLHTPINYKVKTVFKRRRIIKKITDEIYESSTLWPPQNWSTKLEALIKIDDFWKQLIEINVAIKKREPSVSSIKESKNKSHQLIQLDSECEISEINAPTKTSTRGRPKGSLLTVIGLPKVTHKLNPFAQKNSFLQVNDILN